MAASPTPYTELAYDDDGAPIMVYDDDGQPATVRVKGKDKHLQARRQRRHPATGELGWRCRIWDPRTRTQPETTFWGTRDEAVKAMDRAEHAHARSAPAVAHAKAVTVADWREAFLDLYEWKVPPADGYDGVRRPYATWAKAKAILDANLLPALGAHTKMRQVTHAMLVKAIGGLQRADGAGPLAPSSKTTAASIARSFFRDAVPAGVITANPASHLPTVWGQSGTSRGLLIPSILDVETLATAMDASWPLPKWAGDLYGPNGEGHGDLVRLIAFTGLRFEELAATPAQAVHLTRATIDIKATASESGGLREYRPGGGKTNAATRPIIIIEQAVPVLLRLNAIRKRGAELEPVRDAKRNARPTRAKRDGSAAPGKRREPNRRIEDRWQLLVCGHQGGFQGYGHWRKRLGAAQATAGVDYDAHDLRHVAISVLWISGASKEQIRVQAGHDSIGVTEHVYRHEFALDRSELAAMLGMAWTRVQEAETATGKVVEDPGWL